MLAALLGILVGLGSFTFHYGEGLSYFSTDPRACKNCHIMNEEYNSWTKGPHHGAADCVDCHLPHEFIPKYLAKADNGYHHSKGFTLQDFHEPIMIKPKELRRSCRRTACAATAISCTTSSPAARPPRTPCACVHCHRNVGHGARG